VTQSLQDLVESPFARPELHAPAAAGEVGCFEDLDLESRAHEDRAARAQAPARPQEHFPLVLAAAPHQQDFGLASSCPRAEEPSGEDAAPVQHHEVPRAQQLRQVAEVPVLQAAAPPLEDEETRGVALGEGLLRDGALRQRVVEVRELQNSFFWGAGGSFPKCS
jgi:hypothetical protein